jgi:hypothetical protein
MLGGLHPRAWAEAHGERWCAQAQCLWNGVGELEVRVRFLQEDEEREIAGAFTSERVTDGAMRVTVAIRNLSEPCMWSAQAILRARGGGEFISLVDPPEPWREAAAACRQDGLWPALVARDAVLAAPVILQDFPRIAPESPGDLFDATEIDEILSLRILTLTPEEKAQARASGGRVRALLDRVEALGVEGLQQLHGAIRGPKPGDKVRLRPSARADIMDLALAGKVATVVAVEVDFEDRKHVAVTVDDDPGQDLPVGHRFYFGVHEVEPL